MAKKRAKGVALSPPTRAVNAAQTRGVVGNPPAMALGESMASNSNNSAITSRRPRSVSLSSPSAAVGVAMLSKNRQNRVEFGGTNDVFRLGEIYLNDLSDIRVFELTNSKPRRLRVQLKVELRKPFHTSTCNFQLENENLSLMENVATARSDYASSVDEYNHVPASVVRASAKVVLAVENAYLSDGYNELFNQIATVEDVVLEPHETKRVVFSLGTKLLSTSSLYHSQAPPSHADDSSEEERKYLSETSCLVITGRLTLKARYEDIGAIQPMLTPPLPLTDVVVPLQGQACRSLLRLDVKELHFDDCIPGGSFVKDFTVWNRSEIPLLFQLVSPVAAFQETRDLLTFTDYNSGYRINEKTIQAAAYGHVRIRVTYRPVEVGERFFEVHVQNLHDSRNVKILKIHAVTNKEHHREGLSIKEPNGSYFMSGSKLDFGDCYAGIATCKTLLIKNATEASLHVELTSDRPKEVTFELKLLQNRARASRTARTDDVLSPADSNDGSSSRKGSLSPDAAGKVAAAFASFENLNGYNVDSDDDADDNEGEFYDEELALAAKRLSFEENPLGDIDDGDDEFEFDREPRTAPRSPPLSPKLRGSSRSSESRRRLTKKKVKRVSRALSRVRDEAYESGVDSGSICSSPDHKSRGELRRRNSVSVEDTSGSNFLVETLDLPPGIERTILVWYCPTSAEPLSSTEEIVDSKASRLSKQTFRVSFRCFQIQGAWQQAQSRVYDRTLGKSIHVRARSCTSIVTVSPSILHLGDCNIGELKSSSCVLTNHSELPTTVKPLVTSKVISTVPNDDIVLGPKQSLELKVEIIPRKINPNYSRLISIMNAKNKSNIPQVCVRSSNMDAHHVIYHSLFYKLLTPSKSAFLNFEQVAINSIGIQVFDLENITNAPLHLSLQTSDPVRVRLYTFRQASRGVNQLIGSSFKGAKQASDESQRHGDKHSGLHLSTSSTSLSSQSNSSRLAIGHSGNSSSTTPLQGSTRQSGRTIRRRRSFGCEAELLEPSSSTGDGKKSSGSAVLRGYLSRKVSLASATSSTGWLTGVSTQVDVAKPAKIDAEKSGSGSVTPPVANLGADGHALERLIKRRGSFSTGNAAGSGRTLGSEASSAELQSLLDLFENSRVECDRYCHSSMPSVDKELEIAGMIRERSRLFQALVVKKTLSLIAGNKDRNIRIPAKSRHRIIAVLTPLSDSPSAETVKSRIEKFKIFLTLPPGGNKKAVTDATRLDASKAAWAMSKHPFDSRPSVRELLVKSRVCRSVMNVNQKNINFGRITVSSRSSKKLVVQNVSAIPLVYSVEKTGSISSGFLEIKEGEVGVVKGFGTKEICFEFQPTLPGPFEEKLKIINVQDPENSLFVTIKAKIVKRETFKLLQAGQVLSFGKCLAGEKSETIKIAVRNTSRKKREYAIQVDPSFSNSLLRPTFYFAVDDAPSAIITQAQEKKLDEELEKLEHKLRIAVTKKKTDKITTLNLKISRVRALLSGEQVAEDAVHELDELSLPEKSSGKILADIYDSNSESEFSESEAPIRVRLAKRQLAKQATSEKSLASATPLFVSQSSPNNLSFTLEAEAIGRIVAFVIFQSVRPNAASTALDTGDSSELATAPRSQKARKRQLKRDLAPLGGVGKLLLFEQQNKDVVKELQYNADVFLRTPAAEAAYYRAVGKTPLPPVPHPGLPKRPSLCKIVDSDHASDGVKGEGTRVDKVLDITAPTRAPHNSVDGRPGTDPSLRLRDEQAENVASSTDSRLIATIEPNDCGVIRRSTLLIPIEESPSDSLGWSVTLTNRGTTTSENDASVVAEVRWQPTDALRGLLSLVGLSKEVSAAMPGTGPLVKAEAMVSGGMEALPLRVQVPRGGVVKIYFRWNYTVGSGFGSSTAIASCASSSTLDLVSKTAQVGAGKLEIVEIGAESQTTGDESGVSWSGVVKTVDVALVKTVKRSLYTDTDVIDLGQQQQNTRASGLFVLKNRSRQAIKFLLMTPSLSREQQLSGSAPGEFTFEASTGKVDAHSQTTVRFTFYGMTPGQHTEQILVRNLSDRLDTLVVNVTARITRPVYVRVPELDPHDTGTLEVLDLGPCYVTPEMQESNVDSPNVSIKFSKVHKLTLVSQVEETLVLCASSNLKTQCYVFDDARLYREASHVVLAGNASHDLYVAVRPRLPGDAFKTGASRDLVGGIRMQLFRSTEAIATNWNDGVAEERSATMVAEFTIKFVGVAGASLSRVVPSTVEFHMETPSSVDQPSKREGSFEIVNVSKSLPLLYRMFVVCDTDGYSDDDQALKIELQMTKGEVPPGESSHIAFHVSASASGLFRRRILVENTQYPGKINAVDLVLFVDNKSLRCQLLDGKDAGASIDASATQALTIPFTTPKLDLGVIPVISLENELVELCSPVSLRSRNGTSDGESTSTLVRRYRIASDMWGAQSSVGCIVLSNTQEETDLIVRPISTLPLCFQWSDENVESRQTSWIQIQPTAFVATLNEVRQLQLTQSQEGSGGTTSSQPSVFFYGGVYRIPPQGSCRLLFRFATIAATAPLPVDVISSGKPVLLKGMIAIHCFEGSILNAAGTTARTLRTISLQGTYTESTLVVAKKNVSLGKVGYALGWRSSLFEVAVKNASDMPAYFTVGGMPESIIVKSVKGASLDSSRRGRQSDGSFPSLASIAGAAVGFTAWKIEAFDLCVVMMEFLPTSAPLAAGVHEFPVKFFNLLNPHNVELVKVSAQIVSSYAEVTVDPDSSGGSIGIGNDAAEIGFLPPVTVPPIPDPTGSARGPSFWFSVKNVFDEELLVTLATRLVDQFESIAELAICSRSSNTLVNSLTVAPGDSVDIRVICRVHSSARIPPRLFATTDRHYNGDLLAFGSVDIDITVQNMKDATQHKEILVRGKVLPGRTFTLSASSLQFYAVVTDLPIDMPTDLLPTPLKTKLPSSRDLTAAAQNGMASLSTDANKNSLYQLRTQTETFWIRNPSSSQALNFAIDQVPMHSSGLCLIKGSSASEMHAMSEYIQAVPVPSSGTILPGEAMKITVRLEEASLATSGDVDSADPSSSSPKVPSLLHKIRHHPSWRSNSWGSEIVESNEPNAQNHMYLTVRDIDMSSESALAAEVDVLLVLQTAPSLDLVLPGTDTSKAAAPMDRALLGAAFAAREKRLSTSKRRATPPLLSPPTVGDRTPVREPQWGEASVLDHFEEFDVGSIRSGTAAGRKNQLPVLSVRGCTPSENSALESTRYVIDVGQHTVRNGGEVEWEITVESVFSSTAVDESIATSDQVEYRLYLVDQCASSWFQLSRDRGSLDRSRSYQSVVLYFMRDAIGLYTTFLVLQNVTNPGDLKIIHVKLEVIADLNALRSMTSGIDPTTNLFRVLVSSQSAPRKLRRQSDDDDVNVVAPAAVTGGGAKLVVDFGEVYYHKLYHNHSVVIENSSSMTLDFSLSSNAPNEVSFSVSPTSFTEVTTVTLGARGRAQVFLHYRPRPRSGAASHSLSEPWNREVEVYVNCRLVKDFRETVVLRALCYSPQLTVHVASTTPELAKRDDRPAESFTQPSFLGMVFAMAESALAHPSEAATGASATIETVTTRPDARYLVVDNTRSDVRARIALRNDSLFFSVGVDAELAGQTDAVEVDYLENGICAGRRSTLLVSIAPGRSAVFRIIPDVESLRKYRGMWDHSVKEHITLYNIKQFAEHYQVTLCFTCSNVTSYYIPPHIVESYPFSALEDTIAKFLQNYNATWRYLISFHRKPSESDANGKAVASLSITRLAEVLSELESALEQSSPLSPRKRGHAAGFDAAPCMDALATATVPDRELLRQLLHSYRALYFDFFYITDELIWYGVRSNAVRHSLMLADLAYGVVFNHEIFRVFLSQTSDSLIFPRLLLPWSRQLRHFLSFFPENQETTRPLRLLYEQLQKFEVLG